jgi:hypothetical protein
MPGRTAKDDARLALTGASYHLNQVKTQFETGLSDDKQVMLFHWDLRAFFWELVAVRDSVRREARANTQVLAALTSLEGAPWFEEVNEYRNFAHQSFHIVEVAIQSATGRALAFQMQRRPSDGFTHLTNYWNEMDKFLKTACP